MIVRRREFIALVGGVAVAWPFPVGAQQSAKARRLAIVHPTLPVSLLTETGSNPYQRAFFGELRRLGYVEGSNLLIDRHSGEGLPIEGLGELARSVVHQTPDVILTVAHFMAGPLKEATATIPIVAVVNDPVAAGLAASLSGPGGNITGVAVDAGMEVWEPCDGARIKHVQSAWTT